MPKSNAFALCAPPIIIDNIPFYLYVISDVRVTDFPFCQISSLFPVKKQDHNLLLKGVDCMTCRFSCIWHRLPFYILLFLSFVLCLPHDCLAKKQVYIITVADPIGPGVADFVKKGIQEASDANAECLIIELDTPGGLVESMREIVQAMLGSTMPIVTFVSPSGARAASAGVLITLAADIAVMSPGTNIGAAHPVGAGGSEIEGKMSEKVVNDMAAYARTIAEKRGRNGEWAEKSVRESISATETEALRLNIIDLVAKDTPELIRVLNGWKTGEKRLELDDFEIVRIKENIRNKILKTLSDPNVAYLLMMIGVAGLYFELAHPGAIFPGVVGGICILLAFFAFQTLPVNAAGILLTLLGVVFFLMEIKITSYGMLSLAGIISLLLGALMLFDSPELRISWHVLVSTLFVFSAFFILIAIVAFKSQFSEVKTGSAALIGKIGVVKQDTAPLCKVLVHGELWNAESSKPLKPGQRVRIVQAEGLLLRVEGIENTES